MYYYKFIVLTRFRLYKSRRMGYSIFVLKSYLPLSLPTPHTLIVWIGWVFNTVRFSGSINFKAPSSRSINRSLPYKNTTVIRDSWRVDIVDTYIPPPADYIQQIIPAEREVHDTFIDSLAASLRSQIFFGDFYPAQGPHRETYRSFFGFRFCSGWVTASPTEDVNL